MYFKKKKERGDEKLARINHTYTIATIACAGLTVEAIFIPGFQHTLACPEHRGRPPRGRCAWEAISTTPRGELLLQPKPGRGPRTVGHLVLCGAGTLEENGMPFGQGQPCPAGFQQKEHQQGKGAVGACWHRFPHNASFMSLKHRLWPNPTEESPASPTPRALPQLLHCRKLLGETSPEENTLRSESFPPKWLSLF